MGLLVNDQCIPVAGQPKNICYKRSQGVAVISLHYLVFLTSKNKDLKQILKSATNAVSVLKFPWTSNCFSLVMY